MQYALIHNGLIEVGPRNWNYYFFLEYLEDENLDTSLLPRKAPSEAIVTDDWSILPVTQVDFPQLDEPYEQLVGPFWTINSDHITGVYTKTNQNIDTIKGRLKERVAANRYQVEVGELNYTFSDGETVGLYTEREERTIYLNTLLVLPDGETTAFKFVDGKIRSAVTKPELSAIVTLGTNHIRDAFNWEATKTAEIDAATTIEELKLIELRHPSQPVEEQPDGDQ